jgi:branched-subunit amino acid ABC-type transport system permease component
LGAITGLALASIYVLIAISFTMILAASGVFNFAQGTIVMGGTVASFLLGVQLGWPALVTASAVAALGVVAGLLNHLFAVWPAIGRSRSLTHTTMLTTIGLGTGMNAVAALLFGSDSFRVPSYVSESPLHLLSIPFRPTYLVMIAVGTGVTIAVEWVVRRTEIGHMFRATLEDPEGAQLLGIDTRKVIALAFGLAGAMSGLAGFLIAPTIGASAFTAQELAFYGFAGMAIGGFGSFAGSLAGGLIVGLVAGLTPTLATPHLALPLLWTIVIAVLLVKPSGLWGAAGLFGSARLREV